MWPWKKDGNGECHVQDPLDDPTSLPRILVDLGFIDKGDVERALEFQKSNPDIMFGEALAKLELVEQGVIDSVLYIQGRLRDKDADVAEVIEYVNRQAEQVKKAHDDVQQTYSLHFVKASHG